MRVFPSGLVLFAASSSVALAQQPAPADWSSFELNQFITQANGSPESILGMDDNGRIALLARGGMREDDLRRLTGATASQLELLVDWRLLTRDGDSVRTAFPILGSAATIELRAATARAAISLSRLVAPDAAELRHRLEAIGRGPNAFSIVFSFVLDGLTWDLWRESGAVPDRTLDVTSPFWAGEIWATRPPRTDIVGTNSISEGGVRLNVTWSRPALRHMRPFVADMRTFASLFDGFARGRVTDPRAVEAFAPYELFDADGRFTIPVIVRDSADPVYVTALRMARKVVEQAPEALDLPALERRLGFRSASQALIVAYHDLMWDILATLERDGVVERPPILTGRGSAEPSDVGALVFGVRDRLPGPGGGGAGR